MIDNLPAVENKFKILIRTHAGGVESFELADLPVQERKERLHSGDFSEELALLSDDWTTAALSFFQTVPEFAGFNYVVASMGVSGELEVYLDAHGEVVEYEISSEELENDEIEGVRAYSAEVSHLPVVLSILARSRHRLRAANIMSRATLGALFAEFDAFLAKLLLVLSQKQPGAFVADSKEISFSELRKCGDIDVAWKRVVEQEIEKLIKEKSYIELLKWIEERFKVNLTSDKNLLKEFVEISQRRHLLTHADGIVNRRYLDSCKRAGMEDSELPEEGDQLHIGAKYLRRATSRVFQIGFFSLHLLWKKLDPSSVNSQNQKLLETSHEFILLDLTKMCRRVVGFSLADEKKIRSKHKKYMIINKAQSFLFDPDMDEQSKIKNMESALAECDWSDSSATVEVALSCLRRDWDAVAEQLKKLDGLLDFEKIQTWSIFREARKESKVMEAFSRSST